MTTPFDDNEIIGLINGGIVDRAQVRIAFRQMKAWEAIANIEAHRETLEEMKRYDAIPKMDPLVHARPGDVLVSVTPPKHHKHSE